MEKGAALCGSFFEPSAQGRRRSGMDPVRQATAEDLARIAEIEVFSYRLLFYPIFRDDGFYFGELQVPRLMEDYHRSVGTFLVYDDGVVKGFIRVEKGRS